MITACLEKLSKAVLQSAERDCF